MDRSSKVFLVLMALSVANDTAQAQTRQIIGTAGYLSEWELKGALTEKISAGRREFSGPVTWKHIGLCSVNGPLEKHGEMKLQIQRFGWGSRIDAALSLDSVQCTYAGDFSDNTSGVMDCSDAKGVPLAFTFK